MFPSAHDRLLDARLYLLCEDIDNERLDAALRGGVDMVELLEPGRGGATQAGTATPATDDARLLEIARRVGPVCARHGALLILNNRPDLVTQAAADGVHIDRADVDPLRARELIGPKRVLGLSTRNPRELTAAQTLPLDYISVGPVHATATRPNATPAGHALITYASRHSKLPFFAVGGVEPHNTGAIAAAGAQRIAVVRAITDASDPELSARVLRSEIVAPRDFLERYRARTEAQNAAARAKLTPLDPGERPATLRVSVALATLAALINLIAYGAGVRLHGTQIPSGELIVFVLVMGVLAVGMWQRSAAAVLAFMALLAIVVVLFSLFLIEASNVLGLIVALAFIAGGGYLFWKLVRVLGRIQMPTQG